MESDPIHGIKDYLGRQGWDIKNNVKIRGRVADIVATRDGQIALVTLKSPHGDLEKGVAKSLHQKEAANYSYLALHKHSLTRLVKEKCKIHGIGLILVNGTVQEVIRPKYSPALRSVQDLVFSKKRKKPRHVKAQSPLDLILRTKSQILILKLFFLNPESIFHQSDIARKTGLTPPAASKELARLVQAGLVLKSSRGNMLLYQINKDSIIYDDMKRIFFKFEIFSEILFKKFVKKEIKFALIYGSFAKGTEKKHSDIDLLVVGGVEETFLLNTVAQIERNIGREINFILWSLEEFEDRVQRRTRLIKEILDTPVLMIIGDEDEFKRLAK